MDYSSSSYYWLLITLLQHLTFLRANSTQPTAQVSVIVEQLWGPPEQLTLTISCDPTRPCIKASWSPPSSSLSSSSVDQPTSSIVAYNVRYKIIYPIEFVDLERISDSNDLPIPRLFEKNVTRLQYASTPGEHLFGVTYEFRVAAVGQNGLGQDAVAQISMPEAAPSDAPFNFRILGGDESTIQLAWSPPRLLYRNGIITKYQLRCYVIGSEDRNDELQTLTSLSITLKNLPPATHACLVRAWTKAGPGPWSDRVQFMIHPKGPPPPTDIQTHHINPQTLLIEWKVVSRDSSVAHVIIYYASDRKPDVWKRQAIKADTTSTELTNLDPNETYLIRMSTVNYQNIEGPSSSTIRTQPTSVERLSHNRNDQNRTNYKNFDAANYESQLIDFADYPEQFTVQNFKCSHKGVDSISLEWLSPPFTDGLMDYLIYYTGQREYITSSGVLKSVHLGENQIHHAPQMDKDDRKWALGTLIPLGTNHRLNEQQIGYLKPNSQYKFTIRPIYELPVDTANVQMREGIPVTILCRTDWAEPQHIKPPEILNVYSSPSTPTGETSLAELKLHRVSEENGPIHFYYIIVTPDLHNPLGKQFRTPTKSVHPREYSLSSLIQNLDLPSSQAPYIAMARLTNHLFQANQETTVIILGSEETDQLPQHSQPTASVEHPIMDSVANQIFESENMFEKAVYVTNKQLVQSTTYRAAIRVCSQHPDGRKLCSTSDWSEKITPSTASTSLIPTNLVHTTQKATVWKSKETSTFTAILIGLTSGLLFFVVLSIILGCILRRRKQQQVRHRFLETSNQWNAQICRDISKSMCNDTAAQIGQSSDSKCCTPQMSGYLQSQLSGFYLNRQTNGMHSPSNSSSGLLSMNIPRPSTGGLSANMSPNIPATGSINQLGTPDLSHNITRSIHTQFDQIQNVPGSPTRSLCSSEPNQVVKSQNSNATQSFRIGPMNIKIDGNRDLNSPTSGIDCAIEKLVAAHRMPIAVTQLSEFIMQSKADKHANLNQEFQTIQQITSSKYLTAIHSQLEVNKHKNRCPDVLAYDRTRVQLSNGQPQNGSDYINANFVDGYRRSSAYIAAQAPLPNTFGDFWTMIWEQKCAVIVMISRTVERNQLQCDQYWPNSGSMTYSDINVRHLETTEVANYVMRTFDVNMNRTDEHRKLWQLQYTSWPEEGIPPYPTTFLMFLRRVGAITPSESGPIVIHCSSGTGRTGVFIAINILLEKVEYENSVDVFGIVNQLRLQRNFLVQTPEQYQFIYYAVLESIIDGNTEVPARNLYSHIQHLGTIQTVSMDFTTNALLQSHRNGLPADVLDSSLGCTGFQLEFKKINTVSPALTSNLTCVSQSGIVSPSSEHSAFSMKGYDSNEIAKQTVNHAKNRLINIAPFDYNRVILCPIRGMDGSDYINASFVDGYRTKKAYIACQAPMASTVEDFWRMVWEQHSCIIVMLCSTVESGKEKCHKYWPEEKPARYQFFVVDPTAQYTMSGHTVREFKVTDARDGESRTVRQLHYSRWTQQGIPQTGESLIDLIGQVHKTKEQFGFDGPITVHCSSGAGRTGVFITLCNVLERLRQESVVDMYQTVKLLRQQRVWMVQTEDQYRFCYMTALDYLSSFDLCTQPSPTILAYHSPLIGKKMDKNSSYDLSKASQLLVPQR